MVAGWSLRRGFPFLFGGTFIEGHLKPEKYLTAEDFPSFSEGLSLRGTCRARIPARYLSFPFLFGGTFIEGRIVNLEPRRVLPGFPFLFGGTFIEGGSP